MKMSVNTVESLVPATMVFTALGLQLSREEVRTGTAEGKPACSQQTN
jgi:hypothetical protein